MTLDELLHICAHSVREDWEVIHCGHFGPSYLDQFSEMHGGDEAVWLEHKHHAARAVYGPDIAIGLAWGLELNTNYTEDFHTGFDNPSASSSILDFLYHGALVHREVAVAVDGGKCYLPQPELTTREGRVTGYTVTRRRRDIFRMFDSLEKRSDFDHYIRAARFEVVD